MFVCLCVLCVYLCVVCVCVYVSCLCGVCLCMSVCSICVCMFVWMVYVYLCVMWLYGVCICVYVSCLCVVSVFVWCLCMSVCGVCVSVCVCGMWCVCVVCGVCVWCWWGTRSCPSLSSETLGLRYLGLLPEGSPLRAHRPRPLGLWWPQQEAAVPVADSLTTVRGHTLSKHREAQGRRPGLCCSGRRLQGAPPPQGGAGSL